MSSSQPVALRQIDVTVGADGRVLGADRPAGGEFVLRGASGRWQAALRPREPNDVQRNTALDQPIQCSVGDTGEVIALRTGPYANAAVATIDPHNSTLKVTASLTGLPPVFVFRQGAITSVSSPFLPKTARGELRPDLDGVADLLRWGHPIDGRTLFADLRILPANASVGVSGDGKLTFETGRWPEMDGLASLTPKAIVGEQIVALSDAARRLPVADAFVSLSGGLDSRTALVALLFHGHRVPCVTMAGSPLSLDVRLAKAFCDAHGLEHHTVLMDQAFAARAPDLIQTAAELTGGVSCLSQVADLFLYEALSPSLKARISGNLGNQVGRGGVESLSAYRPRVEVFSEPLRQRLSERPLAPWFISRLAAGDYGETLFSEEVPFWSTANYVTGSSRALQLTPYADRRLMQLARAGFARDPQLRHPSWKVLRARDIRHRLRGTDRAGSFQRQFLVLHDPAGNRVPLNWGWRAGGGWSGRWFMSAAASAADASMIKLSSRPGLARPAARWFARQLGYRSALVDWRGLIKGPLRELTHDALAARRVRESGVFEPRALQRMLEAHFADAADEHYTVARSLEIALGMLSRGSADQRKPG